MYHVGLIVIKYDDEEAMMDALIMAEVELKDIEVRRWNNDNYG